MASTAVPTVGSIPWHPPAAQPRPASPLGTRQASCPAPPGLKEQHRSAQNRERRKHSLFLPLPPSRAGGPALRRGRETEARPLPTLRAGSGGGRARCPGSQPQPGPCHGSPAGSWCRGAPCPAGRAGAAGANRLFALPAFPPPAWSRRPRSIPTPRGGTVPRCRTPFPRGVTSGHVSCPTLAGGDRFPPPDSFPTVRGGLSPGEPGGQSGTRVRCRGHRCLASAPGPPPGPERTTSAPEAPKPQLGEVERPQTSSDGEFPTCSAPGEGLTEGTASPAAEMARGEASGTGWKPPQGRSLPGGTAVQGCWGKGAGDGGCQHMGGLGRGHEFLLKGLSQPQAPGKSCFSVSTWKHPRFPPKAGGEELQGEVYRSMRYIYINFPNNWEIVGERGKERKKQVVIGAAPQHLLPRTLACAGRREPVPRGSW